MSRGRDIYGQHLRKVLEHVRRLPPSEQRSAALRKSESQAERVAAKPDGRSAGKPQQGGSK
jgi:hypothetical protein